MLLDGLEVLEVKVGSKIFYFHVCSSTVIIISKKEIEKLHSNN
ncbi:MAG: hypothetical protein GFH27_549279n246 [Chloroflexi bacterium AL-W]|nr:hypothetical protein [Chloroflexi bacterium AL-N1]NOK65212.1 hypothetical protein [Chloroflexi bacterium AL-N10]NOK72523.1 hypothetical protein [Chloroflexi bacterium AL-N5]NOK79391.1 hypothetical protein [Chloroflexi bacterium AL-W]NOK87307.1 hypothetical protein [Chloroflexi bacterium AL-N15]